MKYRSEIDGLRALAVVPVILFHLGYGWIRGGYLGVDVFFVISGFLITSILLEEFDAGTLSFREFWARRIRRIFPLLLTVTAASLAVTYLFVMKGDHQPFGRQGAAALVSVANLYFWMNTGNYWGHEAEESPFLHTWSLSVEEQFYLILPFALWIILKYRRCWLTAACLLVIGASFSFFLFAINAFPTTAFYLLPARTWELGTGCYLAALLHEKPELTKPTWSWLGVLGLCATVASFLLLDELTGWIAFTVIGAGLIIVFSTSGISHALLTLPPVVYVGKLSYSLYLWHWPVFVFAKSLGLDQRYNAVLLLPVAALSIASYYLVEQPTRRREGVIPYVGASYLTTLVLAVTLMSSNGVYDVSDFARPVSLGVYYDLKPKVVEGEFAEIAAGVIMPPRESPADAFLRGGIIVGDDESPPQVVLLGDSHGVMWSHAIRSVVENLQITTSFYSINGVSPLIQIPIDRCQRNQFLTSEQKYQYDKARLEFIEQWHPRLVIVSARWGEPMHETARDLVAFLSEHADQVLILGQPPEVSIGSKGMLSHLCYLGVSPVDETAQYKPTSRQEQHELGCDFIKSIAAPHANCDVMFVHDLFLNDDQALVLDGRNVVYLDDNHLTDYGAKLCTTRFEWAIKRAFASNNETQGGSLAMRSKLTDQGRRGDVVDLP